MKTIQVIIIIAIIIFGIGGILAHADKQDQKRQVIADCIDQKIEEENFPGSLREGWEIYFDVCNK